MHKNANAEHQKVWDCYSIHDQSEYWSIPNRQIKLEYIRIENETWEQGHEEALDKATDNLVVGVDAFEDAAEADYVY